MTSFDISLNGKRMATDAATLHALLQGQGYDFKNAFACAINNTFMPLNAEAIHLASQCRQQLVVGKLPLARNGPRVLCKTMTALTS